MMVVVVVIMMVVVVNVHRVNDMMMVTLIFELSIC